jgi:hypothetical protein
MRGIIKAKSCVVTSDHCELTRGSKFGVKTGPVKTGQLCLFKVRKHLIVGRWFPDIEGGDWIIQPSRWIHCSGADLRLVGAVA